MPRPTYLCFAVGNSAGNSPQAVDSVRHTLPCSLLRLVWNFARKLSIYNFFFQVNLLQQGCFFPRREITLAVSFLRCHVVMLMFAVYCGIGFPRKSMTYTEYVTANFILVKTLLTILCATQLTRSLKKFLASMILALIVFIFRSAPCNRTQKSTPFWFMLYDE